MHESILDVDQEIKTQTHTHTQNAQEKKYTFFDETRRRRRARMMDPLTFFVVKPTKERIRDFEQNTIQIYHIHA